MRAGSSAVALVMVCCAMGTAPISGAEAAQQRQARASAVTSFPAARAGVRPVQARFQAENRTPRLVARQAGSAVRRVAFAAGASIAGGAGLSSGEWGGGRISCVPYARMVTGMQVSGNGGEWWHNAAGLYDRGQRPESGSVLVFSSSGGMRMGHVAVVERQIGSREIRVQHANWEGPGIRKGTPMRDVSVVDVSDNNDWTRVRVQVGRDGDSYGRTYPTYGFIHNRPTGSAPVMRVAAPRYTEVAEAPAAMVPQRVRYTAHRALDLSLPDGVPARAPVPATR